MAYAASMTSNMSAPIAAMTSNMGMPAASMTPNMGVSAPLYNENLLQTAPQTSPETSSRKRKKRTSLNDHSRIKDAARKREGRSRVAEARRILDNDFHLYIPERASDITIKQGRPGSYLADVTNTIQSLNRSALEANTGQTLKRYILECQLDLTKFKLSRVQTLYESLSQKTEDVTLRIIATNDALSEYLGSGSPLPALIPPGSDLGKDLVERNILPSSISELLRKQNVGSLVSTQNYDVEVDIDSDDETDGRESQISAVERTIGDILARQAVPSLRETPLNCLDLRKILPVDITPPLILHSDLIRSCHSPSIQMMRGTNDGLDTEQFYLISEEGSASHMHVDGTYCTYLCVPVGEKIVWYLPPVADLSVRDQKVFAYKNGTGVDNYSRPVARLRLSPGSTFIMPPGTPHAVYTPKDCYVIGGFFLPPSQVPRSIRSYNFLRDNPFCTNDDPHRLTFRCWRDYFETRLSDLHSMSNCQEDSRIAQERWKCLDEALALEDFESSLLITQNRSKSMSSKVSVEKSKSPSCKRSTRQSHPRKRKVMANPNSSRSPVQAQAQVSSLQDDLQPFLDFLRESNCVKLLYEFGKKEPPLS